MKTRIVVILSIISLVGTLILVSWIVSENLYDQGLTNRYILPSIERSEPFLIAVMLISLASIVLPFIWFTKRVNARIREWSKKCRLKMGLCAKCGYDLRATPERCPECGKASNKKQISTPSS